MLLNSARKVFARSHRHARRLAIAAQTSERRSTPCRLEEIGPQSGDRRRDPAAGCANLPAGLGAKLWAAYRGQMQKCSRALHRPRHGYRPRHRASRVRRLEMGRCVGDHPAHLPFKRAITKSLEEFAAQLALADVRSAKREEAWPHRGELRHSRAGVADAAVAGADPVAISTAAAPSPISSASAPAAASTSMRARRATISGAMCRAIRVSSRNMPGAAAASPPNTSTTWRRRTAACCAICRQRSSPTSCRPSEPTSRKIHWIARLNDFQRWRWSAQRQGAECRAAKLSELVLAPPRRSTSAKLPIALNRMIGTRFKVIPGYTTTCCSDGAGETDGRRGTSWEPLK